MRPQHNSERIRRCTLVVFVRGSGNSNWKVRLRLLRACIELRAIRKRGVRESSPRWRTFLRCETAFLRDIEGLIASGRDARMKSTKTVVVEEYGRFGTGSEDRRIPGDRRGFPRNKVEGSQSRALITQFPVYQQHMLQQEYDRPRIVLSASQRRAE